MMIKVNCTLPFIFVISVVWISSTVVLTATAQENPRPVLQNYVPPPLFGTPSKTPPPVNNTIDNPKPSAVVTPVIVAPQKPVLKIPATVPPQPNKTEETQIKTSVPRLSKQVVSDEDQRTVPSGVPVPEKRPSFGVNVHNEIPAPTVQKQVQTPIKGVVKGPVSMPSVKAHDVEIETVMPPAPVGATPNMLARIQKSAPIISKKIENPEKKPAAVDQPDSVPAIKKTAVSDGKNTVQLFVFDGATATLSEGQKNLIESDLVDLLKNNLSKKLHIVAYASDDTEGLSSDRRISLSRALAVRSALLSHQIDPSRINVRAMGAQTDKQPFDRVDLSLE